MPGLDRARKRVLFRKIRLPHMLSSARSTSVPRRRTDAGHRSRPGTTAPKGQPTSLWHEVLVIHVIRKNVLAPISSAHARYIAHKYSTSNLRGMVNLLDPFPRGHQSKTPHVGRPLKDMTRSSIPAPHVSFFIRTTPNFCALARYKTDRAASHLTTPLPKGASWITVKNVNSRNPFNCVVPGARDTEIFSSGYDTPMTPTTSPIKSYMWAKFPGNGRHEYSRLFWRVHFFDINW
jgi:hypothetical protein